MRPEIELVPRWWTTSDGSVFLPPGTKSTKSQASTAGTPTTNPPGSTNASPSSTGVGGSQSPLMTTSGSTPNNSAGSQSSIPIPFSYTITSSASLPLTFTSTPSSGTPIPLTTTALQPTTVTTITTSFSIVNVGNPSAPSSTSTSLPQQNAGTSVCVGHGVDTLSLGVFSTLIFGVVVGGLIWLLFAILRPRIRQLYALREWFIRPELRPQPLGSGFFAFLFPHVPLVPSMPNDVSDFGESPASDSRLFPSDDELSQRTIWTAFLLVLGWTMAGLVGAIPLYTVSTPCTGNTMPDSPTSGEYSALQDLSLIRLLRLVQDGNINTKTSAQSSIAKRLTVDGKDYGHIARVRLLILTVLVLVVAVLPALFKLMREFNKILAFRRRWLALRCDNMDMGWLSIDRAPGLRGLGEADVKELFARTGITVRSDDAGTTDAELRRRRPETPTDDEDGALTGHRHPRSEAGSEINVTGIFSVVDTSRLSKVIDTRASVLNNLEQAECLYIDSFKLSSPEATLASFDLDATTAESLADPHTLAAGGRQISRPKPLRGSKARRHHASLSSAPTTYVAPSSYYRLRGVRGVSGGSYGTGQYGLDQPRNDEFGSHVAGSRFQEVSDSTAVATPARFPSRQASVTFARLPRSNPIQADQRTGQLNLDQGPNHGEPSPDEVVFDGETWLMMPEKDRVPDILERRSFLSRLGLGLPPRSSRGGFTLPPNISEESFFSPETGLRHSHSHSGGSASAPGEGSQRYDTPIQRLQDPNSSTPGLGGNVVGFAPHQRFQLQRPLVRPVSGLHHEHLGALYDEIRRWRAQLKALNLEVADEQQSMYEDIARGTDVRGWLLIGRGVRFVPGVRMIEGRSKDDVRWKDLQHDGGRLGDLSFWIVVVIAGVVLAGALIPVMGLFMSNAPGFAQYVPAIKPLVAHKSLGPAIATTLAASMAAILFISIALGIVHYAAHFSGAISNTETRLTAFKGTFWLLIIVAGIWLLGLGAVLFSLEALNSGKMETTTVSEGVIYAATFVLVLGLNLAFIAPGLLMLQPFRLWKLWIAQWKALTPRQHFRAIYPKPYNPSFAMGACILAVFFSSTLAIIFPLLAPPLVVLTFLTLIAHRYLVGYVYSRTDRGQSGGLLQLWIIRRFASMLALQPFLLGLILLAFRLWTLAGVLLGSAFVVVVIVETYTGYRLRLPGIKSLSEASRESLEEFTRQIKSVQPLPEMIMRGGGTPSPEPGSEAEAPQARRARRTASMASVLDMITNTLAVSRTASRDRAAVPLAIESIDDLVSTARAAATHPDAPQSYLLADDPADEVADLLYPPELLAPDPAIWLVNDTSGVGQAEAGDLERFHHLATVVGPRAPVPPQAAGDPEND